MKYKGLRDSCPYSEECKKTHSLNLMQIEFTSLGNGENEGKYVKNQHISDHWANRSSKS